MTELFDQDLKEVIELDEKDKQPAAKFFNWLNNGLTYVVGMVILIQVLVGSAHKFGTVSSSTTSNDREDIQTFNFDGNEFKHYFLA